MKTLILFRHGKSDWKADYDRDHERPLAKRGRKAAKIMGRYLSAIDAIPDSIISSTAVRTRQTLERAASAGDWQMNIRFTQNLYLASTDAALDEIRAEPDTTDKLLLVGHEPTFSNLTSRLIGGGDIRFPTATMARIDLDIIRWKEVSDSDGQLIWLVPPRLFS